MNIEEMRKHEWIVSWSGGKDSTATIILMHEHGVPIKEIIYVRMMYDDTLPATLPVMTDFVDKAKSVFEDWDYSVRIVPSRKTVVQEINSVYTRSKREGRNGKKHGISSFCRGKCVMTRCKTDTIHRAMPKSNEYQMIGYAADETKRHKSLGGYKQSIMLELGILEKDTYEICKKYGLLSPLYELGFARDGCWFCPSAAKKERNYIRKNHPDLVEKIYAMCDMCEFDISYMAKGGMNHWVEDWYIEKGGADCLF